MLIIPEQARRSIARELSLYYEELAGNEPREAPRFSFGRAILEMATERGLVDGREGEICRGAAKIAGKHHDPHRVVFPFSACSRDLVTSSADQGGFLVRQDKRRAADVMRTWSATARAGLTILDGLVGTPNIPRVLTAATSAWRATETASATHNEPVLGEVVATPKSQGAFIKFSRQLALQADAFDAFIEAQLFEAAGALLDQAVLAGTGVGGQPLGIANTAGVGAQAGASLDDADTRAMRKQVLEAGATEDSFAWVGSPSVQDVLSGRERFVGGGRAIWDDARILGRPAAATAHMPSGTLIGGDWSRAIACIWGPGFVVEIDPYTNFTTAKIQARVLLYCDVVLSHPAAFSVATSVS